MRHIIGGFIAWLSQSPDLNAMNIFLRKHLKKQVSAVPASTTGDFVARVQAVLTQVDARILRRASENAVRRADVCLEINGGGFEN
jgi:hypothetical protein